MNKQIANYGVSIPDKALPKAEKPCLLIVGMGDGWAEEAKVFLEGNPETAVAAVNDVIAQYKGDIDFACSTHSTMFRTEDIVGQPEDEAKRKVGWLDARSGGKKPMQKRDTYKVIGTKRKDFIDVPVALDRAVGGSAMLALLVGKALGFKKVVLAGVTLEGQAYGKRIVSLWEAAALNGLLDGVEVLSPGKAMVMAAKSKK